MTKLVIFKVTYNKMMHTACMLNFLIWIYVFVYLCPKQIATSKTCNHE